MDQRERLLRTLDREEVDRVPCATPLQTGTVALMRLMRRQWPAAHGDPVLMTELAFAAHRMAGLEAVRVPFDVTVDASAFGAVTDLGCIDRQPAVLSPLLTLPDLDRDREAPRPGRDGRAPVLLVRPWKCSGSVGLHPAHLRVGRSLHARLPIAWPRGLALRHNPRPGEDEETVGHHHEMGHGLCPRRAIETGADIITIVDATSTGSILGPAQYAEFALPFQAEVVNEDADA